jgi:colanic acid biosynthesis glycosyl transferase WcaI
VASPRGSDNGARSRRVVVHDYSGHPFQAQLSRELARRGYVVEHQYCSSFETGHGALEVAPGDPAGFSVVDIPLRRAFSKYRPARRVLQEFEYAGRAARAIRRARADHVVLCNIPLLANYLLCWMLRARRQRYAFWHQDVYSAAAREAVVRRSRLMGPALGGIAEAMERSIARGATRVIAITDAFREVYQRWRVSPERVSVIPNWAPIAELPLVPADRGWLADEPELRPHVALYSGTLGLKHDPDKLLQLARSPMLDDCSVVVVSQGKGRDWLEARSGDLPPGRLVLRDFVPYESLPGVMASADVLITILEPGASRYSVPSKMLSYMCAGRPILAAMSASNAASQVLSSEGLGIVVDDGDPVRLAEALRDLLDHTEEAAGMGKRARRVAERDFDIHRIGERFESALGLRPTRGQSG